MCTALSSLSRGTRLRYSLCNIPAPGALSSAFYFLMRDLSDMPQDLKQSPSVYSLPPEILGRIFEFLADLEPPRASALQNRHRSASAASLRPTSRASVRARRNTVFAPAAPDKLGYLRVSHVCHYFRSVALAYPALWDTIPFSLGENWVRLALEFN